MDQNNVSIGEFIIFQSFLRNVLMVYNYMFTGVIITAQYFKQLKPNCPLKVIWGKEMSLELNNDLNPTLYSAPIIIRELSRLGNLCGLSALECDKVNYNI